MKKHVCETCRQPMTEHTITTTGNGLVWVCPELKKEKS